MSIKSSYITSHHVIFSHKSPVSDASSLEFPDHPTGPVSPVTLAALADATVPALRAARAGQSIRRYWPLLSEGRFHHQKNHGDLGD